MTIHTYQSPDWEIIRPERRKALEAVVEAAFDCKRGCRRCDGFSRYETLREKLTAVGKDCDYHLGESALKETDDEPNKS